jgi:phospholipase C
MRLFTKLSILFFLSLYSVIFIQKPQADPLKKIGHIVVIYMENRSFDQMFYGFPGADTAANANFAKQVDADGKPYSVLNLPAIDNMRLPPSVENKPFSVDAIFEPSIPLPNPIHRFYQNQFQINGGRNDRFVLFAGPQAKGLAMGYHLNEKTSLWKYAEEDTLCDHFFQGAFGGSFINHHWLIAAATPVYQNAPMNIIASNVGDPAHFKDGSVTPDGYAVNNIFPEWPGGYRKGDTKDILPPQTGPTIADRLNEKSVSWKWYSQGWNMALKDINAASEDKRVRFTPHHIPFLYYKSCMEGTKCFKNNLADRDDLINDIRKNEIPKVVFYKPGDANDQHPGTGTIENGDQEISAIVNAIKSGKLWEDTVIIVTYDENGGFWDHVSPPASDRWGPGTRVPTVVISSFAKKHFVDHTVYDTTSILKLIEKRFALKPLGGERSIAKDLLNTLDLSQ